TSPAVAEEVVDRLGLAEGKNRARAIHNISRQIKAEAEPESNIIKISYSHPDRERAADVTNATLDAYLNVRARVALDYSAVDYLDRQARRIKAEMDSVGAAITSYGAEDGHLTRGYKSEKHMGLISRFTSKQTDLDASIYSMEEKIAMTEEWLASGADVANTPSGDIYDMATVQQVKWKHLDMKSQVASARARYAPDHPEIKRLERELTSSAEAVRVEVEQALLREKMRLEEWKAERRATVRILADLKAQNPKLSDENMQIRMLEHELSMRTDLYAAVVDKREQFRITAATDPSLLNVGVVSRATVPVEPTKAGIDMKSVFAFFTLLFGFAFVFAVERMDQSLVRRSDIERELGLKVLAVVRHRSRG
ncbi:MAG: hypothetical protein KAJ04_09205, partial [Candidatus Eisenbacteria sp.]|nr:hypothetical protein [Candidatus Eisenbacteria bacterium]